MHPIKIMIVDDEVLAIEDLRNLIDWDKHGFEIVAEANNGKKALELYEKYRPQIIFADISMPVMDGLEFSSKVAQYNNNTKIILLTSYKDFEYAKQAVKIGVSNYLLKHEVNEKNLLEELEIIKSKIQNEERNQGIKRQRIIKMALEGKEFSTNEKDYWQKNIEGLGKNFVLLIVKKDMPYPILNINSIDEEINADIYGEILNLKNYSCSKHINYIDTVEIKVDLYTILLTLDNINSQRECREILYNTIDQIQKKYRENTKNTISVVVTSTLMNKGGISNTFKRGMKSIGYMMFVGIDKIIWTEELNISPIQEVRDFENEIHDIYQNIVELNYDNVKLIIDYIFVKISLPPWDLHGFVKVCKGLIHVLEKFRENNNLTKISDLLELNKIDTSCWYSVNSIRLWFDNEITKAMKEVEQVNLCIYSRKIKMVIQYIQKHYQEEIVIEKVAEAFGMSGVYLSQLFKKETGETFLKYLTSYRVKVAKDLLASNKYSVNEIAVMVGYNTSQYFSKIFHEATSVTPKYFMKTGGNLLK